MQTFEQYFIQLNNEGFLRNVAAGAMLGASLLGGANMVDAAPKTAAIEYVQKMDQNKSSAERFATIWAKLYNAEKADKTDWALKEIKVRRSMPDKKCTQAIKNAVYCFGNDAGFTPEILTQVLLQTGRLESNFSSNNLESKTGAKGYWQVLGTTAYDRLHKGAAYFGKNFEKVFAPKLKAKLGKRFKGSALKYYQSLSTDQLRDLLKTDPDFCAAIAAAKWVTIAQQLNNKQTKTINKIWTNIKY